MSNSYQQEAPDNPCERAYRRGAHQAACRMLRMIEAGATVDDLTDFMLRLKEMRASKAAHGLLVDEASYGLPGYGGNNAPAEWERWRSATWRKAVSRSRRHFTSTPGASGRGVRQ